MLRTQESYGETWSPSATSTWSRTTGSCWTSWLTPSGPDDPSPWISSVTDPAGKTSCGRPAPWLWKNRSTCTDSGPTYGTSCPATGPTSSLAIMEAMSAGLPIVAGNTGPIAELCDDGVEARFWPLDDPARAAAVLIDLLDSEPARLKAASAASERFRRDFDAEIIAPRLRSFLLGSHPSASGNAPSGPQPAVV